MRQYLETHPTTKDAVIRGVANYAALARVMEKETGMRKGAAVSMAIRRYAEGLRGEVTGERRMVELLRRSSIEVKTKIAVIILIKYEGVRTKLFEVVKNLDRPSNVFFLVEGSDAYTIIINDQFLDRLGDGLGKKIIRAERGLSMLLIKSPEQLEETPGVTAFLTGAMAHKGINIVELMSCWKDTIFIVRDRDTAKAYETLSSLMS